METLTPLMRRALRGIAIGLALFAGIGEWWQSQPAGAGTRIVIALAKDICPDAVADHDSATVADGAYAIDPAVVRRIGEMLEIGPGCRVRVRDTGGHRSAGTVAPLRPVRVGHQ